MVSQAQTDEFAENGVAYFGGAFTGWVDRLLNGLDVNMASPSPRGRLWDRDAQGRSCFYDSQVWREIPEYEDFARNSSCAEVAGRLMGSASSSFFFDAIFVRTPGAQFRTPFHQDEPYWSVEGFDTCSVWVPLVPVEKNSALEFVKGSHRWPEKYRQENFGSLTGDDRDQVAFADDTVPFPDIESNRAAFDILSWDMEPGDAVFFNARIIHGGSGNLREDRGLKVFNTQWLGDDVRVRFREEGMDPDHCPIMQEYGLSDGAMISDARGGELYPQIWTK